MKRLFLFITFLSIVEFGYSQNISVSSFKMLDTDLTANTAGTMETDQNGETAALIKVVTTQTGFTFDGGALGIVKTVQKPSEIWVYVPRGLKKITISHPQLGMLRDYYLTIPIEAARTYEMVLISGEVQTIVKQQRTSQYVVFQLNPPEAVVELNGELLKTENGIASKMMKFGTYNYRVQAPDYILEAGSVTIDNPENKKVVNVSLKPNFAQVTIKVDNNAEIWVNGEKKGEGTWSGNLGAGTYELEARKSGHRSTMMTRDFEVVTEPQTVILQSPIPVYGEANINTSPGMAVIYLDGKKVGQTPQILSNILIGSHIITIEKEGYETTNETIKVEEGITSDINITLKKSAIISTNLSTNKEEAGIEKNSGRYFNKEVDEFINLGKDYLSNKDPKNALKYAEKADNKAKHKSADAYLLLGDIESSYGTDAYKAADYYNQAIVLDPQNPEGYKKWALIYRKISPSKAEARLRDMEKNCPEEDANATIGHIYMLAGDENHAYENYAKVDIYKLDKSGLNEFVRCSYFTGHFEDALRAAETGLKIDPRDPTFNRLAMFSNYELQNYDAAKSYINKYFNETEGAVFSEYDHFYAALIYQALGDNMNTLLEYKKALECTTDSSMIKRWAILKSIADTYTKEKDYENAIIYYTQYLNSKQEHSYEEIEGLANIYSRYSDINISKKDELIGKAIDLYQRLAKNYPMNEVYTTYMIAGLNHKLDPKMEKGLAKPDYQKVISLLRNKQYRNNGEDIMLKTAYHYMMYSSYMSNNKSGAKEYARRILEIDPDYEPALEIINLK